MKKNKRDRKGGTVGTVPLFMNLDELAEAVSAPTAAAAAQQDQNPDPVRTHSAAATIAAAIVMFSTTAAKDQ